MQRNYQIILILLIIQNKNCQQTEQDKKLSDSHSHNFLLEAQNYFYKTNKEQYELIEVLQLFLKLYGETNMDNIRNVMKKIHLNHDITASEKHDIFLAETIEDFLKEVQIDDNKKLLSRKTILSLIQDNSFFHYLEQKEEKEQKPDLELLKEMVEEDEKYEKLLQELEAEDSEENDLEEEISTDL